MNKKTLIVLDGILLLIFIGSGAANNILVKLSLKSNEVDPYYNNPYNDYLHPIHLQNNTFLGFLGKEDMANDTNHIKSNINRNGDWFYIDRDLFHNISYIKAERVSGSDNVDMYLLRLDDLNNIDYQNKSKYCHILFGNYYSSNRNEIIGDIIYSNDFLIVIQNFGINSQFPIDDLKYILTIGDYQ